MSDLNKIINKQRERIAELQQKLCASEVNHKYWLGEYQELRKQFNIIHKRAEAAERDLKNAENRVDAWKEQVNEMRETQFRRFNNEECWIYHGDGEDYPESLICPVVISAEQLRAFLVAEKRIAEVEQEREVAYENWQKKYQYLKDSMTLTRCYECGTLVREVSPRSRCCMCEYGRATFNERDNEQLRQKLNGGE